MRQVLFLTLLLSVSPASAQDAAAERELARLPADLQSMLRGLPPADALRKVRYARENLVATGATEITPERLRGAVEAALEPRYAAVRSVSAGATSFPPLSPLVPESAFEARR